MELVTDMDIMGWMDFSDKTCKMTRIASSRYVLERHSLELDEDEETVTGAEHIDLANQV